MVSTTGIKRNHGGKKVNVNKSLNDTVCGVFMNQTVWCFLMPSIQLHDPSWECPVTELELKWVNCFK